LIAGDRIRLEQIFINLLTNARKYASGSPRIDVRLEPVATNPTTTILKSGDSGDWGESGHVVGDGGQEGLSRQNGPGGMVEVQVQDYGPGIPAADLPRIFSAFYQVERRGAAQQMGVGLGLYITHQLVAAHGGTIRVSSEEGVGTTFTFRFPLLTKSTQGVDRRSGTTQDA